LVGHTRYEYVPPDDRESNTNAVEAVLEPPNLGPSKLDSTRRQFVVLAREYDGTDSKTMSSAVVYGGSYCAFPDYI